MTDISPTPTPEPDQTPRGESLPRMGPSGLWSLVRRVGEVVVGVPLLVVVGLIRAPFRRVAPGQLSPLAAAGRILVGQLSLLGPSKPFPIAGGKVLPPGYFSEAALSHAMGLEEEADALDRDYCATVGPRTDVALLLKSLWVACMGGRDPDSGPPPTHFDLFDVFVNNSDTVGILRTIEGIYDGHSNTLTRLLRQAGGPLGDREIGPPAHVCFVNANNFNLAIDRPEYRAVLRRSELVLPDGIGVKLALQMAGGRLNKNLNGTDLFPHLAQMLAHRQASVFVLGAETATLEAALANISASHPELEIAGSHNGFFQESDEENLCNQINQSGAAVLLIGMGTPRQELFVGRNLHRLQVSMVFCLGGLLDFLGGKNRRAPRWMRQSGLEWVYRILQEPGRMWQRYIIGNPLFLWRVRRWIRSRPAQNSGSQP